MSNTASGSAGLGLGFWVLNAPNNTLTDNVAFDNAEGFQLEETTGTTMSRNHSYNNGIGFVLHNNANANTVSRNVAHNNNQGFLALGAEQG